MRRFVGLVAFFTLLVASTSDGAVLPAGGAIATPSAAKHRSGGTSAAKKPKAVFLFGDRALERNDWQLDGPLAALIPFRDKASGAANAIHVYVGRSSTLKTLVVGLYGTPAGAASTVLLASGHTSSLKRGRWNVVAIHSASLAPGRTYWVTLTAHGGALQLRARRDGCRNQMEYRTNAGPPKTWHGIRGTVSCVASAYVTGTQAAATAGGGSSPPGAGAGTLSTAPVSDGSTGSGGSGGTGSQSLVAVMLPSITGVPGQSQTLDASPGIWSVLPASYAYQWEDCGSSGSGCSDISGATLASYTLGSGDVGDTVRVVVTASNGVGSGQAASGVVGPVTGSGSGGGLPGGVSLQQIDGGTNYYCGNGFTYACSAGWDHSAFVPILDDYAFYSGNSTSAFKALGLTTSVRVTGGTNMSYLNNAGITAIQATDSTTDTGAETVGGHIEEPGSWSAITSNADTLNSNFGLSGRFLQGSFTWNQLYYKNLSGSVCGGNGTMTMPEIFSCTSGMPNGQHLNIATDDLYWFADTNCSTIEMEGGDVEGNVGNATADEMDRGSNYGDMVDIMRTDWLQPPASDAPIAPYIENSNGLSTCSGERNIQPQELQWAAWSTIVHGARMLIYFGTTGSYESTFGFDPTVESGEPISMENQAKDTDTLVESLAPIINSPFALHYASVSPAGYSFPTLDLGWSSNPEIDEMTKYYTSGSFTNSSGTFGNGFYIFASPRSSETATNISATFKIPGTYTGPVNVIDASEGAPTTGTLTVNANHQITDTFANAYQTQIIGPIPNQ